LRLCLSEFFNRLLASIVETFASAGRHNRRRSGELDNLAALRAKGGK
jgi:hypothetical protein